MVSDAKVLAAEISISNVLILVLMEYGLGGRAQEHKGLNGLRV